MPMAFEAARGRAAIEESREIMVVLDREGRVVAASRRAREALPDLELGQRLSEEARNARRPVEVPYDALGERETLLYLSEPSENAAYDELRAGFTAAVSHELRTPLARLLSLLETAALPGEDPLELIDRARREVEQIGELIDDVLFLSELETGRQVVALGATPIRETAEDVVRGARRIGRSGRRQARSRRPGRARGPAPATDAARRPGEPRRERDPVRGAGRTLPDLRGGRRRATSS